MKALALSHWLEGIPLFQGIAPTDIGPIDQNSAPVLTLDVTKSQLAALLGTIPATIFRAFYRLSQDGLIVAQGAQIELLDCDRLQKLSQACEIENRPD